MHVFCAAVLFAISLGDGVSAAGVPKDGVLEFDIVRNGESIGTHTYLFDRSGNRTEVRIKTEINFRLFFYFRLSFSARVHGSLAGRQTQFT